MGLCGGKKELNLDFLGDDEEGLKARKVMEAMQWNDGNNRWLLRRGMKKEPVITTKEFWKRFDMELIDELTKKELRNACEARGLGRKGHKMALQQMLEDSLVEERELDAMEVEMKKTRDERDHEATGSVYVVGRNDKGQLGLGHRRDRSDLRCLHALSGVGVVKVYACQDTEATFALCANGDLYSWGAGDGPLGQKLGKRQLNRPDRFAREHVHRRRRGERDRLQALLEMAKGKRRRHKARKGKGGGGGSDGSSLWGSSTDGGSHFSGSVTGSQSGGTHSHSHHSHSHHSGSVTGSKSGGGGASKSSPKSKKGSVLSAAAGAAASISTGDRPDTANTDNTSASGGTGHSASSHTGTGTGTESGGTETTGAARARRDYRAEHEQEEQAIAQAEEDELAVRRPARSRTRNLWNNICNR